MLEKRPGEIDVLYGVGVCRLEQGKAEAAIEPLSQVVDSAPLYRDFAAYPELSQALIRSGRENDARELLEQLAKRHPLLPNVLLLSRHLIASGETEVAREHLRLALRRYRSSPRHVRRSQRRAAGEARAILAKAASRV